MLTFNYNIYIINKEKIKKGGRKMKEQFLELLTTIQDAILANKPADVTAALAMEINGETLETMIANATATIGEKITLRRFEIVEKTDSQVFGAYMHMGGKISALSFLFSIINSLYFRFFACMSCRVSTPEVELCLFLFRSASRISCFKARISSVLPLIAPRLRLASKATVSKLIL